MCGSACTPLTRSIGKNPALPGSVPRKVRWGAAARMSTSMNDSTMPTSTPLIAPSSSTPRNAPAKMPSSTRLTRQSRRAMPNSVAPMSALTTMAVSTGTGRKRMSGVATSSTTSMVTLAMTDTSCVLPPLRSLTAVRDTLPDTTQQPTSPAATLPTAYVAISRRPLRR